MGLRSSYFSLGGLNPLPHLERLFHPYRHTRGIPLRGGELQVRWTERAERRLARRDRPLPVEMQIYFACVVKKRVLFPEAAGSGAAKVEGRFLLTLRTIESARCDPIRFAADYPARAELTSTQASQMRARELRIDYRKGMWQGEFFL